MFGAHAQPILAKDVRDFCHRARVPFPALKSLAALVAHLGLGQSAEPSFTIALSGTFRNLRRHPHTKRSTIMSILCCRKNRRTNSSRPDITVRAARESFRSLL